MNTSNVIIKSYLPLERRERSKLQQVKDKHRSFTQTNKQGIPKDLNELKSMKYRDYAITFLNEYMNIDKKTTKSKYCKNNHISHNSLNTGLKQLRYKTNIKSDQSRPIETKPDQSRPIKTKRKNKQLIKEENKIIGGEPDDEELNEMVNNSLVNLQVN